MRRLYVGGLSHTVTQKDLKDRFGKFGEVEDVELRTRRDDEGVPYKTFGYININISDADLKKCLTVLNKSKWKGGTLQIETAKESFLHRLAEERQTAAEQRLPQTAAKDERQKLLDSMSKAGVDNFTMKAAVPGTEIPGHKDWVVSKFGRVLPVLQLRSQRGSRARTLKYDPSKYSHNIRKLDRSTADQPTTDQPTPVTQLTWEVQGGDDDISKKRRGEFPPYEPPTRKKSRTDVVTSHAAEGRTRLKQIVDSVDGAEAHQITNGYEPPANHRLAPGRGPRLADSDMDSDEEIHRMARARYTSHAALRQEEEDDKLEVVGLDYLEKSSRARRQQKGSDEDENEYDSADTDELFASRKAPPPAQERLALPTAEPLAGNNTDRKGKTKKKKGKAGEEEDNSADSEKHVASRKPSSAQQSADYDQHSSQNQSMKIKVLHVVKPPSSGSDSDDEEEEEKKLESDDYSSDSDYEAMFSNATRLELSLADLQRLAEESQQTCKTTAPSMLSTSPEQETNLTSRPPDRPAPKKGTTPEEILAALMEEDSSEDEQKKTKKSKGVVSAPLPAFQGTRALNGRSQTEQCQRKRKEEDEEEKEGGRGGQVKKQKLGSEAPQLNHRAAGGKTSGQKHRETQGTSSEEEKAQTSSEEEEEEEAQTSSEEEEEEEEAQTSSEEEEEEEEEEEAQTSSEEEVENMAEETQTVSSSSSEEEESMKANQTDVRAKAAATASPSSSSSSAEEDEEEMISADAAVKAAPPPAPRSKSSSSEEEEEEEEAPPRVALGAAEEEERQRKANTRRLAAVKQRQKEAEEHKKLIQGALANLDAPTAGAGKHIVFGSDDEGDDGVGSGADKQTTSRVTTSKKTPFQDSQSEDEAAVNENNKTREKPSGSQLFGGSDNEEDADEEEDGSRFDIRPQFEGQAGQKLMELQSRFGTDQRFRMDSRFLEEDEDKEEESGKKKSVAEEEEALDEERKKNLSILQSVLGSSQQPCSSKTASKGKTFRDVSALHYDPSKEEHAAFETKTDETKKESKSARRKKREEAQKLPEVSKEIYYDVSGDLKAVFGQTKKEDVAGEDEKTNWDQEEEQDEEEKEEEGGKEEQPALQSSLLSEKEEASGFKFSFFGDDPETGSGETEYKVESIQAPKVSWQKDLRFHDSSSDEDEEEQEEEQEEEEEQSNVALTTEEETPSKTDLFFFYPEDSRLTEGPRLFCRASHLEEQREQWEERRSELRQEYRKKHKDARRKLKSSQKS